MELKANKLAHIRYTKSTDIGGRKGETTDRVIIPTYVPADSIKALDVSDLGEQKATELRKLTEDYAEYVETKLATIFSFEDWLSHTGQPTQDLKHRTFKLSNTTVIKSE